MLVHRFLNKYVVKIVIREYSFEDSPPESQTVTFVKGRKMKGKKKILWFTKKCALFFKNLVSRKSSRKGFPNHLWQGRHKPAETERPVVTLYLPARKGYTWLSKLSPSGWKHLSAGVIPARPMLLNRSATLAFQKADEVLRGKRSRPDGLTKSIWREKSMKNRENLEVMVSRSSSVNDGHITEKKNHKEKNIFVYF